MNKEIFNKYMSPIVRNESGIALVIALLTMTLLSLLGTAALTLTEIEIKISANDKGAKEAFYIAEAGIEHARAVLMKSASFDDVLSGPDGDKNSIYNNGMLSFGPDVSFAQGAYDVKVTDNNDGDGDPWDDNDDRIIISSTGTSSNGSKRVVEVVVTRIILSPNGLKGSVTSNSLIDTGGNMQIDGRDHDLDGNFILGSGSGILGISTTSTLNQGGSSDIGGTDIFTGIDYAPDDPSGPGIPFIIEENATWIPPATPEKVLGLTMVDQLKTLAMRRHIHGSQYVTDPSLLTFPLSGITYVELPSGDKWNANAKTKSVNFKDSTGILIVHNKNKNAVLKNTSIGTFKGIIIADKYEKIHNTIIGAVVTLASAGGQIGNGNGAILYSQEAIDTALTFDSTELITESWREIF